MSLIEYLVYFLFSNGKANAIKAKIKKVKAIGLVKNINQFPSKITSDCLNVPSTNSPKIKPIITGTTENPYLLIKTQQLQKITLSIYQL